MKKRNKKPNKKVVYLQESLSEAYEEIQNRGTEIDRLWEELHFYHDFVEYHKLEKLFFYFKTHAHKEDYPDLPFDHYTL
ncbi:MAG: hypothetical protein Q4E53_13040 [Eubacteriales bacterium]|nr:hypothetical protein [Eubacteriales bacterium]